MTDPIIHRSEAPERFEELREYVLAEGPRHCYLGKPISPDRQPGVLLRLRPAYLIVDADAWGDEQLPPDAPQGVIPGKVFLARLRNALPLYALPSLRETALIPGQVTELRDCSDAELEWLFGRWIAATENLRGNIHEAIERSTSRVVRSRSLVGLPPPPQRH